LQRTDRQTGNYIVKALHLGLFLACGVWVASLNMACSQPFTFTTMAGLPGSTGASDGTNSDAQFNYPSMDAVDSAGNLFVADTLNHTIRRVTRVGDDWVVSTVAGSAGNPGSADGTNSDARFDRPNGLAIDKAGNAYVVDHYNHTIRKMQPVGADWVVTTVAGTPGVRGHQDGTNGDAQFYSPTGIAVDSATNLYVTDTLNFTIRQITPVGTNWVVKTIAGTALNYGLADGTGGAAAFDFPYGIAVDSATNLFVADWGNNVIRKIMPSGGSWVVSTPVGSLAGTSGSADGTNNKSRFYNPNGIAVDHNGNLYVADQYNYTIRKVSLTVSGWVVSTIGGLALQAGGTNGTGGDSRFDKPWGIAVDGTGNLFIVDYANQTLREGVAASASPVWLKILPGSSGQVVVSWPVAAAAFRLEGCASLAPGATWIPMTNGVAIVGNNFVATNVPSGTAAFYRLRLAPF
jgi:hypothetical protein